MVRRSDFAHMSRDYRRPQRWQAEPPRRVRPGRSLSDPRQWLRLVMLVAVGGLVALPIGADAVTAVLGPRSDSGCRVVKVIDGDTISLWCSGRGLMKTRLKGFDAPEVFSPACFSEWTSGMAATWHLRRILFSADTITVGFGGTDRYGRALASIAADGRSVSGRMIAEGYARAYDGGKRGGWCEA